MGDTGEDFRKQAALREEELLGVFDGVFGATTAQEQGFVRQVLAADPTRLVGPSTYSRLVQRVIKRLGSKAESSRTLLKTITAFIAGKATKADLALVLVLFIITALTATTGQSIGIAAFGTAIGVKLWVVVALVLAVALILFWFVRALLRASLKGNPTTRGRIIDLVLDEQPGSGTELFHASVSDLASLHGCSARLAPGPEGGLVIFESGGKHLLGVQRTADGALVLYEHRTPELTALHRGKVISYSWLAQFLNTHKSPGSWVAKGVVSGSVGVVKDTVTAFAAEKASEAVGYAAPKVARGLRNLADWIRPEDAPGEDRAIKRHGAHTDGNKEAANPDARVS